MQRRRRELAVTAHRLGPRPRFGGFPTGLGWKMVHKRICANLLALIEKPLFENATESEASRVMNRTLVAEWDAEDS